MENPFELIEQKLATIEGEPDSLINSIDNTKADTPWKGSLYATLTIIAGIIISFLN